MNKREQQGSFRLVEGDVRDGIAAIGFVPDEEGQRSEESDSGTSAFGWGPPFDDGDANLEIEVDVVPWTFICRHDGVVDEEKAEDAGIFQGLFPTGREVTIRGVTFVDRSSGEPQFYRYVDWADALTQLGCTVSQRVLLNEDAYTAGLQGLRSEPDS